MSWLYRDNICCSEKSESLLFNCSLATAVQLNSHLPSGAPSGILPLTLISPVESQAGQSGGVVNNGVDLLRLSRTGSFLGNEQSFSSC